MKSTELILGEFLVDLKAKLLIYDVIYENRKKNLESLTKLGLTQNQCTVYIKKLQTEEYVSGPTEASHSTPLWVFGKNIKGKEIYIKIQLNTTGKPVICISFHIAEHPMIYPFKTG